MSRNGDWMQTASGRQFWPLDPRPEDVHIEDIAHALSNQCRFAGHCRTFYCPAPDQRVLTADLRWTPAGELRPGDELLAFDEHAHEMGTAATRRRRFRHATVLHAEPVRRHVLRLVMEDGAEVVASAEHPWLVATKVSRNQRWLTTRQIADDINAGRRRYMHRFMEPWSLAATREAGWLAGLYDGEGYLSFADRKGTQLGVSQRPGAVLDEAVRVLKSLGFASLRVSNTGDADVLSLQMKGGWREIARLLGSVRPIRLIDKFVEGLREGGFDKHFNGQGAPPEIVRAVDEGEQWVAGLETSTHTFLCEGFGAHNSVAEHSVRVAEIVPPDDALWALLHDAPEAYLVDLPRPLKRSAGFAKRYREVEDRLMAVICERFGLPVAMPEDVKRADNVLLVTEARDLMREPPAPWRDNGVEPLSWRVVPWHPATARAEFLDAFNRLTEAR